jgi:hypothetical protein
MWKGHVALWRQIQIAYKVLVGRTEVKRRLGRPSRRWEDNITTHLQQVGWRGMDWIDIAEDNDS